MAVSEAPFDQSPPAVRWQKRDWLWLVGLAVATLLAYQSVWQAGFIWDDDANITQNLPLRTWHGLSQIWLEPGATQQYYPLTYTTFWLEYHLWQLNPPGYHVDNVLLHIGNALMLGLILRKLEVKGAWLAAALFAFHPVNVESVAWATERKNTLSGLLYLASLFAALEFWKVGAGVFAADRERKNSKRWAFYLLALALYLAALCSKTAVVPLPAVVLLLLWWKRPKLTSRDVCLLLPFFIVGVALGLMTLWVERGHMGTTGTELVLAWPARCLIFGDAFWFYLGKLIWPYPLIFIYPRWSVDVSDPLSYLPLAAAAGGMLFLWSRRKTSWRPVFVAMAYFVLLLLPASALFNQYFFRFSFVADHFQYLACIGPLTLAAAAVTSLLDLFSEGKSWLKPLACGTLLSVLGLSTWFQTQRFVDSETLWRITLAQNPTCWVGFNYLGNLLLKSGRPKEAMDELQEAVRLKPDFTEAHNNLGAVLEDEGRLPEAIEQYRLALDLKPDFEEAHYNLGIALQKTGRLPEAIDQYWQAIQLKPDDAAARDHLGTILEQAGRIPEAEDQFQHALQINPDDAGAHYNLGVALQQTGRLAEATEHYERAVSLYPNDPRMHNNLGVVLQQTGRTAEAIEQYQVALSLQPDNAGTHGNLGLALQTTGRLAEAIEQYREALRISPHDAKAQNNLARAEALLKSNPEKK